MAEQQVVQQQGQGKGQAKKRATVASNAKEIDGIRTQLSGIEGLLKTLVGKQTAGAEGVQAESGSIGLTPEVRSLHATVEGDGHGSDKGTVRSRARSVSVTRSPRMARGRRSVTPDRLDRPRQARRELHETAMDLNEDLDLQRRVSELLCTNLNPVSHSNAGKRYFAHAHVVRGQKKVKTGLGELSLAEYNFGLIQMLKYHEGSTRRAIQQHIEDVNEDAISYQWAGVRGWSEEVCTRIHENRLSWHDATRIEYLRLKLSQVFRGESGGAEVEGDAYKMEAEVAAAKAGPACRQYNFGSCFSNSDHVVNGYRHLHICSYCIYNKCAFLKHPERECKGKRFKTDRKKSNNQGNDVRSGGNQ